MTANQPEAPAIDSNAKPSGAPAPLVAGLHHASLLVADLHRALDFYVGVIGLCADPERPEGEYRGAWLQLGSGQIHLLELPNPDPREGRPPHPGRDRHVALVTPSLERVRARLQASGVAFTPSRSGRRALFCRDPDGNGLEFVEEPRA